MSTYPLISVRRLCDHVLLQVLLEPGQVRLLGEEELLLLPPREYLDKDPVVGHGALDGVPRHDRVPLGRVEHPQVEQIAELDRKAHDNETESNFGVLCLPTLLSYLAVLIGGKGFVQPSGDVFAERCAISRLDLEPLRWAPASQEAAQTARLVARAMDLSALVFEACVGRRVRGHVRQPAEAFDVVDELSGLAS